MTEYAGDVLRIGTHCLAVRKVSAGDTAAESLFVRAFGETPPPGWRAWKYSAAGLDGRAIGLWSETGELVAHYAGFPRRLLWHGRPLEAIQIGDVMVAPAWRFSTTRRGPFFHACSRFFGQWVGRDKPFAVAFGFPHARAIRLGAVLGLYENLGPIASLAWPATGLPLPWGWRSTALSPADGAFDRHVARAWRTMARECADRVLGVRDVAYVRARFVARPGGDYHFLRVWRRLSGPAAIAVLRIAATTMRWLDFIGPRSALTATTAAVRTAAARAGASRVEMWASPAVASALAQTGAASADSGAFLALARASVCPDDTLATSGWWMGGDTDFL